MNDQSGDPKPQEEQILTTEIVTALLDRILSAFASNSDFLTQVSSGEMTPQESCLLTLLENH
jgi:hypothetical protein